MREVVSLKEAKARGLKHYFTGKPCKRGHIDTRLVSIRACMSCMRMYQKEYYERYPDRLRERGRQYYKNNREQCIQQTRDWEKKNPGMKAKYDKEYYLRNREKVRKQARKNYLSNRRERIENAQRWFAENKERRRPYMRHYQNARRRNMGRATPPWADLDELRKFYEDCPEGYEVDHIIPLKGKNVCGLHCVENLQYLTRSDNAAKHNWFPENGVRIDGMDISIRALWVSERDSRDGESLPASISR